jgi:hypothetical protein
MTPPTTGGVGGVGGVGGAPVLNTSAFSSNLKLPAFLRGDISQWLTLCEVGSLGLEPLAIYSALLRTLPPDVSIQIADVVSEANATDNPDWAVLLVTLKDALKQRFADSDRAALVKLLSDEQRGTRRPSQFLRDLRQLVAGRKLDLEVIIKSQFYKSLPLHIQSVLMTRSETLDAQAVFADQLVELYGPHAPISSVAPAFLPGLPAQHTIAPVVPVPPSAEITQMLGMMTAMAAAITNLAEQVAAVTTRQSRSDKPAGNSHRNRSQSGDRNRGQSKTRENGLCYYHDRFGQQAHHCREPCVWVKPSQAAKLNAAPVAAVSTDQSALIGQLTAALAALTGTQPNRSEN